jgi:hypothetical protein
LKGRSKPWKRKIVVPEKTAGRVKTAESVWILTTKDRNAEAAKIEGRETTGEKQKNNTIQKEWSKLYSST